MVVITTGAIILGTTLIVGGPISLAAGLKLSTFIENSYYKIKNNAKVKKILKKMNVITFKITKQDISNYDDICVFCQEDFAIGNKCCTLKCSHTYHKKCLEKWVIINTKCPLCNQ